MLKKLAPHNLGPAFVDASECDGSFYLVMERFDGALTDLLRNPTPKQHSQLRDAASALASRLDELRIFHGDLNTGNMLFRRKPSSSSKLEWVFTDFAFAMQYSLTADAITPKSTGFTNCPYPQHWFPDLNLREINVHFGPNGSQKWFCRRLRRQDMEHAFVQRTSVLPDTDAVLVDFLVRRRKALESIEDANTNTTPADAIQTIFPPPRVVTMN